MRIFIYFGDIGQLATVMVGVILAVIAHQYAAWYVIREAPPTSCQ